jgi:hypothetical protein
LSASLKLFLLFAAGVVDNGGNLPTLSLTPAANSPPVSLTPVANLPPVSKTAAEPMANLPLVLLILGVHLDLQISLRIFEKIRNDPNVILRGLGEDDS